MSAAGQQLGVDMANNFMLMTLFSLVADMADDPGDFRNGVKKALLDLTDGYNLAGVADGEGSPRCCKAYHRRRSSKYEAFTAARMTLSRRSEGRG